MSGLGMKGIIGKTGKPLGWHSIKPGDRGNNKPRLSTVYGLFRDTIGVIGVENRYVISGLANGVRG